MKTKYIGMRIKPPPISKRNNPADFWSDSDESAKFYKIKTGTSAQNARKNGIIL